MIKKGDKVIFNIHQKGEDVYLVSSNQYELKGRQVVDLDGYLGEVAVEYLEKVNS